MKFNITESDKHHIQKIYGLSNHTEETTPLQRLMECKITSDGKYIIYEGKAYLTRNGMQVPLNEEWSLSDTLHAGADLLSMGMDFVFPGSGAIVDMLNGISYVIEAQFKPEEERDSLYVMAAITWAFVIIPGPLQAVATPLKNAVKTGVGFASKTVVNGLKVISNIIDILLARVPSRLAEALKSPLAKNILGKWGTKISEFFSKFASRIKTILSKITGKGTDASAASAAAVKIGTKEPLTRVLRNRLVNFLSKRYNIRNGKQILKNLGFVEGKTYSFYLNGVKNPQKLFIEQITDKGLKISNINKLGEKSAVTGLVSIEEFIKNAIGAPWYKKGYTVSVPFFIKRFASFLGDNGMLDYSKIGQSPDLDPNATSKETMDFMSSEVSSYEGETGAYTVKTTVQSFQRGLMLLGATMRGNDDGKFGPETKSALEKFQKENGLDSSLGKMDRYTAKKLSEVLRDKKPKGNFNYEEIASQLDALTKK
jgi:peptidoglycan hydrolase-like protein with peptidoglycan-binding domain